MPKPSCRRCGQPLAPIHDSQTEHPLCSPTSTGWIPKPAGEQAALPVESPVRLALDLAALGWHVFPLSRSSRRPMANCPACREGAAAPHRIEDCRCLSAGCWCHGVRAATTDPARIAGWWGREPAAVPGVAAGPSGLVLVDIDCHGDQLPERLATGLLPGIDLAAEPVDPALWRDPARFRDGRDTLGLLAHLRGRGQPWPAGPEHQPVVAATPSGGRHLWYRAPAEGLRQAIGELAWQVDIKAGWNYGVAPGARTAAGSYRHLAGDPANPGRMPDWLAHEVLRVATARPPGPAAVAPPVRRTPSGPDNRRAHYLDAVIDRRADEIAQLKDGRQLALSALAYQVGGLLAWSGQPHDQVLGQLVDAGTASGLPHRLAHRIARRALARGIAAPLPGPRQPRRAG